MEPKDYILNIVEILGLSKESVPFAVNLFDKAVKARLNSDNTKAALALACIYTWCIKNNMNIVLYEFESASFIESELIKKAFGDIQSEFKI